jgi:hypothetical protein
MKNNNNKKINRPICRTKDKVTEKKIELLCAFLDNGPITQMKNEKNNSANMSNPGQGQGDRKKSSY